MDWRSPGRKGVLSRGLSVCKGLAAPQENTDRVLPQGLNYQHTVGAHECFVEWMGGRAMGSHIQEKSHREIGWAI